jgi:hypothetical protein
VDPRAGLDDVENRKFLTLPGLELDRSAVQPIASRYIDWAIPALQSNKHILISKACNRNIQEHSLKSYGTGESNDQLLNAFYIRHLQNT